MAAVRAACRLLVPLGFNSQISASLLCRSSRYALIRRCFRGSGSSQGRDNRSLEISKQLISKSAGLFEELAAKRTADKFTYCSALQMYITKENIYRRGHVEFIYAAMDNMEAFDVHRDLAVYKELLEVFPKAKMVPKSAWQVEFMHFPKQQQCAIDLMDKMEDNGVIPDHDFGVRLMKVFGTDAHAFRKYRRMMYWMPKFKHANPYPIPKDLPEDSLSLAILALKRMAVDTDNKITVWNANDSEQDSPDNRVLSFIASAMSIKQQNLIKKHNPEQPLFVEGGYPCWLRHKMATYFILRSDPDLAALEQFRNAERDIENDEKLFDWSNFWEDEEGGELLPHRSVHEQDDGTVLAMAVTGTGSKDSLVTWIRCLQQVNPALEQIPVVFRIRTPDSQLQVIGNKTPESGVQIITK